MKTEKLLESIAKVDEKDIVAFFGTQKEEVDIEFGLVFIETLENMIATKKINMSEIRVFLALFKLAEYGNLLKFNQTMLAKKLEYDSPRVSRAIKKLSDMAILINVSSGLFINPFIVSKGRLTKIDPEVLKVALESQHLIPCPFPKVRKVDKANKKGED